MAGIGTGIRFYPATFVSIGIEGRAQLIALDASQFIFVPQGLSGSFIAGLNVGVHIPIAGGASARAN
jgi:hypothetical protein